MKKSLFVFVLLTVLAINAWSQVLLNEDFTGLADGQIPAGWSKSPETTNWGTIATSNAGGEAPEMRFNWSPSSTDVFRLITPELDASDMPGLAVRFKHMVNDYSSPPGGYILKVQSSVDLITWTDEWVLEPTGDVDAEIVTVDLIDLIGEEELYLAFVFDGNSYNINQWYIDDVIIWEPMEMEYVSSTVTQDNTSPTTTGAAYQEIIGIQIVTDGDGNPFDLTEFNLATTGSTDADDIANAKLWYTGTSSSFSTLTQFGATYDNPDGDFTITGTQTLASGTNHFWLTYDIALDGTFGNVVDAVCNSVVVNDTTETPDVTNPPGNREIVEAMVGSYVINHDGTGDYLSFAQAIDNLIILGVSGPVVFEVAPGTYTEQIVIPEISYTSEVNTITFTAMDDTEDTIITYTPTDTNTRYVVKFDGAKNIRFDNLTVEVGTGASHGWIMHITNGCEDIEITNNQLSTIDDASTSFYGGIIVSGSPTGATSTGNNVQSILIENNVIHGGYYGITLIGASGSITGNARIIGNDITSSYYYGMYLNYWDSVVVTDNFIDLRSQGTTSTSSRGIHCLNGAGAFEIGRNKIVNQAQYGIYMASTTAPIEDLGLIHNNMIGGGFTNTGTLASAFYITTSHNIGIFYNSVNNDSQQGRTFYSLASTSGLHVLNNSFAFTGTGSGYASYHVSSASIAAHDHNNYYSGTSPNFVYYDNDVADLAALQAINIPDGNDQGSLDVNPHYVGEFDLDLQPTSQLLGTGVPIPHVLTDFYGNPRHPEFPAIGAHEMDTAGFGSLDGYVYNQADDQPMSGVNVFIEDTNYSTMTNDQGYFVMPFVMNGTYEITAEFFGFHPQVIEDVVIIEDETTSITFNLEQFTNVTVSGQIVGSDYPAIGLSDAAISLTGYDEYFGESDADGFFSIPGVYINQTYNVSVVVEGYSTYQGEIVVGDTDLDVGVIIVDEVAFPPNSVIATQNPDDTEVDLIWNSPSAVSENFFDFEENDGEWIPSATWDPVGDWEWTDSYDANNFFFSDSQSATPPPTAISGTGLWGTIINTNYTNSGGFSYLTREFDFTAYSNSELRFWSWNDSFGNWDYGQVTINGDLVWGPAWDYSGTVWEEVVIDLSPYDGLSEVIVQFEHYATTVVAYAGWYIDDVYVGPARNLASNTPGQAVPRFNDLRDDRTRILENYRIYRFGYDDIGDEDLWSFVGTATDTTYTDLTWADVPIGFYRYAVKAEYTNDVLSDPAISNWVGRDMTTNVTVNITTDTGDSADGATVSLTYQDQDPDGNSPVYTETAIGFDPSEANFFNVLRGTYNLEVSLPGFTTYTQTNISIIEYTEIDIEIEEYPYPPANLHYTAGSNIVNLMWEEPITDFGDRELDIQLDTYQEMLNAGLMTKAEVQEAIEVLINSKRSETRTGSRDSRNTRELLGYNLYRNNEQLNTDLITVTNYTDSDVINNETYVYYVTAVYTLSESVPSNSVTVVPGPQQLIIIGEDTTSANTLPLNFFYKSSLSQTIYMQSEINAAGLITEIQYFNNFNTDLPNMPVKIWMGITTQTNLSDGWINADEMELVFDGNIDFPSGPNTISIQLDEFFLYTGTGNIVITANRPLDQVYYSSSDHFHYSVTTDYPNRSRHTQSDTIQYDPYNPPTTGTLTDRVPNTGLNVIAVGMGSLMGHVYYENDDPVEGATVTVVDTPFQAQTNAQGYYFMPYVFEGEQTIIASKFGYYDDVVEDHVIIENETTTQNFTLLELPTVSVSGRIVGSDQPDVGLDDGLVILEGYNYYESNTDDNGLFAINGVYADHVYDMTVQRSGYQTTTIQIDVGSEDLDLGDVVVDELAFPPFNVIAELTPENDVANIIWSSPDSYQYVEYRYDDGVPTASVGLPSGTNTSVLGSIHPRNSSLDSMSWYLNGGTNHSTVNLFVFGLDDNGQPDSDNILLEVSDVPNVHNQWNQYEFNDSIDAPNGFFVGLSVSGNLGIAGDDGVGDPYGYQNNTHYYSTNYTTGNWMTMESAGYYNNFLLRAQGFDFGPALDRQTAHLSDVRNISQINKAKVSGNSLIFDNKTRVQDSRVRVDENRVLVGYIVYRLIPGQEDVPQVWIEIGTVTDTTHVDTGIPELLNGNYRYAVRSVYTNNVISDPAFSNIINYQEYIPIITNINAEVINQTDVMLTWEWAQTARTNYSRNRGMRDSGNEDQVRDREFLGFKITRDGPVIAENIMETEYLDQDLAAGTYIYTVIGQFTNGSTNMLFVEAEVHVSVDDIVEEPLLTMLQGNRPNPFNPDTFISYSLSEAGNVSVVIYNVKGQIVRTLVNDYQQKGRHEAVWNGRDDMGRDAGSGIFFYRMKSGSYTNTKKMILMK